MMTWKYLAGFLDGEGTIFRKEGKVAISLCFSNTDKEVIEKIRDFLISQQFPARVYCYPPSKLGKRDIYQCYIHKSWKVKEVLERLLPYLIVKKDEAVKAINCVKTAKRFMRELSESEREDIISRYQRGESPKEISKKHGCSSIFIYRFLKRGGHIISTGERWKSFGMKIALEKKIAHYKTI